MDDVEAEMIMEAESRATDKEWPDTWAPNNAKCWQRQKIFSAILTMLAVFIKTLSFLLLLYYVQFSLERGLSVSQPLS